MKLPSLADELLSHTVLIQKNVLVQPINKLNRLIGINLEIIRKCKLFLFQIKKNNNNTNNNKEINLTTNA